ncbi:MAG TPA: CdaR family protein [Candidatus Acidoferrales bacterium]|nr:CdaR family protein [Candidatus Acidoferrales bacterium]
MRDLLFKDFGWKLFSLLLAAFIWYTVEKIVEEPKAAVISPANVQAQFYEVPVLVVAAVGADRAPSQVNSNTVSVTVSGPPAVMNILQPNQIHATVDLSDFDHKSRGASRRVDVSVPWGVTVIDVEPAQLTIVPQAHP